MYWLGAPYFEARNVIAKEAFKGFCYFLPTGTAAAVQTCTKTRSCTQCQSRWVLGWTSTVPLALFEYKYKIRCENFIFTCLCVYFFPSWACGESWESVWDMPWPVIQRCLIWSALLCDVNALFNWRSAGPNAARALLSDLIGPICAIHPAHSLALHQSSACQFAQTAIKYVLYWVCVS